MSIARAVEALADDKPSYALRQLLLAWRITPSAALRDAIDALSAYARTPTPPEIRGNTSEASKAWLALLRRDDPTDVPALLDAIADAIAVTTRQRIRLLAARGPDPRVAAAYIALLERMPSRTDRDLYTLIYEQIVLSGGPDIGPRLDAATTRAIALAPRLARWLAVERTEALARLARRPLPTEPPPDLSALGAALAKLAGPARAPDLDALLAAVYESPDDDGPRLVYADALIERGDPRGTFIVQQCKGITDETLLRTHARAWLGELAPVLAAGYAFERGFLGRCAVNPSKYALVEELAGNPRWATVRDFDGPPAIGLHPGMRGLRRYAFDNRDASRAEDDDGEEIPHWRELLCGAARRIEALRYTGLDVGGEHLRRGNRLIVVPAADERDALRACTALPALRALELACGIGTALHVLDGAAVLARLASLTLAPDRGLSPDDRAELAAFLATNAVPRVVLSLAGFGAELVVEDGRATLACKPARASKWAATVAEELDALVAALPMRVERVKAGRR